jgi:aminotransferase
MLNMSRSLSTRFWSSTPRPRSAARLTSSGVELSPIKAIELRASTIPGVVSLAQGIPSFDTPAPIKQFVQQKIDDGSCARYSVTPGLPALREAIAEALRAEQMPYDPETEIIVTAGSIEAIGATLLACIDPGDEVVVVSPTYASYIPAIQIAGGVPRFAPLNEDANFDLDPEAIADAVTRRTRALFICNPNNPTGTVFSAEQTRRMLEVAERHDLLVLTDEVYKDFLYGDATIYSAARELSARDRVIRVFSFSKAYAMTGWRVGFVHGPARLIRDVLKVHDALVTCAPVASQYAALAALELGDASIAAFRTEFRRRRDHVLQRLDALPHVFDYQKPNASYFVFPRIKDTVAHARNSRRLAEEILERAHVALVPGVAFGPTGEAHLRLCYARPAEDIDLAFDRLDDFFAGRPLRTTSVAVPATPSPPRRPWFRLRRSGMAVLRWLARVSLRRQRPRIVAITGSQGKTVLKRQLQQVLGTHLRVRANRLSHNTEIGVLLAILDTDLDTQRLSRVVRGFVRAAWRALVVPQRTQVLILELGVGQAGDMQTHLAVVRPHIAIVTALVPSLSNEHEALDMLRHEIATLADAVGGHGCLLVCRDDPTLATIAAEHPGVQTFSSADATHADGTWILPADDGAVRTAHDLVGASSVYAALVTVRVAHLLGMSTEQIAHAFENGSLK